MIFAADRCRERAPNLYVADSAADVSAILNPRLGDIAMVIVEGVFSVYELVEGTGHVVDDTSVLESNSCEYVWVLAGTASGGGGVGAGVFYGNGSPEGVLARSVGSLYTDISDTDHPVLYIKTSGAATDTGWVLAVAT